jgi:hypothetical protein
MSCVDCGQPCDGRRCRHCEQIDANETLFGTVDDRGRDPEVKTCPVCSGLVNCRSAPRHLSCSCDREVGSDD